MKKVRITQCRYCGGTEFVNMPSSITVQNNSHTLLAPEFVRFTICLDCGSILRSYVIEPERLLTSRRKKERKASKEE